MFVSCVPEYDVYGSTWRMQVGRCLVAGTLRGQAMPGLYIERVFLIPVLVFPRPELENWLPSLQVVCFPLFFGQGDSYGQG